MNGVGQHYLGDAQFMKELMRMSAVLYEYNSDE
jgi:hypothetical protein